jgi:MFS transporter, PPP family, 3-phenylpropionic acid transporter
LNRARVAYVIYYVGVAAYAPYLQLYYGSLGITLAGVGALAAFSSLTAMIAAPVWGLIHDRNPSSRLLIPLASVVAASGGLGLGMAGASLWLIPSVAAFSIGMTGISPMMDVRVLEMTRSDRTRYASVRVFGSIGFIAATPIIGFAIHQNYRELFVFFIPIVLVAGLSSLLLPGRSGAVRAPSMMRAPGTVLRHRPILLFLAAALVGWTAISAQNPFFSIYLGRLGASSDQIGWAWSSQALLEIPAMVFFPLLARKYGAERLIVAGMTVLVMRQTANAVFTMPAILIGFSLLQGLGYGLLLIGGIAFVSQQAPRGTAATAQGILNATTFSLASIIGAGLGGQIGGILSLRTLFALSAGLGAISVVLMAAVVLPGSAGRLRASRLAVAATEARAGVDASASKPGLSADPPPETSPAPAP